MKKTVSCLAMAALAFACSGPPEPNPDLGGPPGAFMEFTASAKEYFVNARASYVSNQKKAFGLNLAERGVIPIKLSAQAFGDLAEKGQVELLSGTWAPKLYLQDGTALERLDIEDLKRINERAYDKADAGRFTPNLLTLNNPIEGYLFFKISPLSRFSIRGNEVVHSAGGVSRGLNLHHSLLSFKVTIDDESYPIYVGVKPQ